MDRATTEQSYDQTIYELARRVQVGYKEIALYILWSAENLKTIATQRMEAPALGEFNDADLILRLPPGQRIRDIKWLSVWCRRFTINFGEVLIPAGIDVPKIRILPEFKRLAHGLRSDNISILDAKTFYIPNLHYDGAGPAAYFWVGNGSEPHRLGIKVPNEVRSLEPLRGYQGEDIEIQLPGSLTVYDIDWLCVWCIRYTQNFGHVMLPKDLDVPPALNQTKISTMSTLGPSRPATNCRQFLNKRLQVRWELIGDKIKITLDARINEDEYAAFGLSGDPHFTKMIGGDVTVVFYDSLTDSFNAVDYYLSTTAQCDGKHGVCPDEVIGGRNDVAFVSGERFEGVTSITFLRPLQTNEAVNDRAIPRRGDVSVIAAIGPLNSKREANAHGTDDKTMDDEKIDFSRTYEDGCPVSLYDLLDENTTKAFQAMKIEGIHILHAKVGPTGGKKGYSAITGQPSWGISWYINDLLIPEITVVRGQTYVFIVEGGNDKTNTPRYHPLYVTDSSEGGYGQKNPSEQVKERIYAGVAFDHNGYPYPTAAGRYCEYSHVAIDLVDQSDTFDDYFKTLKLLCEEGEVAHLNWTVPLDAPNTLYYQCYIHRNLGWKINVVDASSAKKFIPYVSLVVAVSILAIWIPTQWTRCRIL
ncbi:Electron transfer DM13 [Popillia japonica]|uniref:Electron transfer DM13 n=1 Tax=Popillia japonica TaxID=7064 RepID=A0AAW1KJF8_POPJA